MNDAKASAGPTQVAKNAVGSISAGGCLSRGSWAGRERKECKKAIVLDSCRGETQRSAKGSRRREADATVPFAVDRGAMYRRWSMRAPARLGPASSSRL